MKRMLVFLAVSLLVCGMTEAAPKWRYYWIEAVLGGGGAWYRTDIGPAGLAPVPAAGIRYKFHPSFSVKLQGTAMFWKGIDAGTVESSRGYAYSSFLVEPLVQLDCIIYRSKKDIRGYNVRGLDMDMRKMEAYLFSGFGGVYSSPQPSGDYPAAFQENFNQWGRVIPLGAGVRHNLNYHWTVVAEAGYRFVRSDYLEGLKEGSRNDRYLVGLVQICYRFRTSPYSSLNVESI